MEPDELQRAIQQGIEDGVAAATRNANRNPSRPNNSGNNALPSNFGQAGREITGVFGDLTGAIGRAGGSVADFTSDMSSLAGRLPGIGGALEFFGGTVEGMVGYLETTNRTFQALSKVGGGFNGDLGALRVAAANTRMPLDQFANLIGRNSQALAGLGTGVNDGARRFAELSRAMFEDGQVIRGMTNLGYTIEEANEFLLDNATLLRRQQMREGMTDQQVAQATLRMAENMAYIAEVTGESAEQQRQELIDAQRDGRNIAALRQLEAQGLEGVQEGFTTAFQGLSAAGPAAQAYLQDMIQAGAPLSETTQAFAASQGETAGVIAEMAAVIRSSASAEEKRARLAELSARANAASSRELTNSTNLIAASYGQISGYGQAVADQLSATENFRLGVEQMQAELSAQGRNVSFEEAAVLYEQRIRDRVGAQAGGGAEGQALSRELNLATIALADSAAGVNSQIGRNLSANTELQSQAAAGLRAISQVAVGLGGIAEGAVNALAPGQVSQDVIDTNNFRSLFEPIITTNGLRTEISNLGDVFEALQFSPDEIAALMERFREQRETGAPRASGGPVFAGEVYQVGERGPETFVPGVDGAIVPNMDRIMSQMQSTVQTIMPNMRAQASAMQGNLMQLANSTSQSILPTIRDEFSSIDGNFAQLSNNGSMSDVQDQVSLMQNTLAQLANNTSQTILPDMNEQLSPVQGNLMQMVTNLRSRIEESSRSGQTVDPNTIIEELRSAMNSNPDISTQKMEQLLDNLNQSMLQLVSINNNMSRNGARTVEALRGASGNLLQGVRAR